MIADQRRLENVQARENLKTTKSEDTCGYVGQKTQDLLSASLWVK